MSYNNYVDAAAAYRAAYDHGPDASVAIIKHTNPCGIAVGADVAQAHRKAHACDPVSAFGGVIATNVPVSVAMAEQAAEVFTEVLVAPGYDEGAVEVLATKKNIRLLACPPPNAQYIEQRPIPGGMLVQTVDRFQGDGDDPAAWRLASGAAASDDVLADLAFAWRACRAVKSNAILLAAGGASVGVGMGQVNRVDSPASRSPGPGNAPPARWRPPTPSSRSPTAWRSCSTRACAPSSSRVARCATTRSWPRLRPPG